MSANSHKKLRLVKVIVQPILVLDDGKTLTEQTVQPITVPAAEWGAYPEKMAKEIAKSEIELNGE